jgi:GNAT superfamily N-acetyltransferase
MTHDVGAVARLLGEVFPGGGVDDEAYLRWLYVESPFGPMVAADHEDAEGLTGHVALIPLEVDEPGAMGRRGALALNTAVHERARGRGLFTRLAEAACADAAARGVEVVYGVANANATPGWLGRLRFALLGPLPATLLWPRPARGQRVRSSGDAAVALADPSTRAAVEPLLATPVGGVARRWTVETLAWRVSAPGRRYALHFGDQACVVSTAVRRRGIPVAVISGAFAPAPLERAALDRLVASACRRHRAPVALHLGHNALLPAAGWPLPERLRESPLNLIRRDFIHPDEPAPPVARWEALDFDAF